MSQQRPLASIDADVSSTSDHLTFEHVLATRLSRRQALVGGMSASAFALLASAGLVGCDNNGSSDPSTPPPADPISLGFTAVAKSQADLLSVPTGYTVSVLYAEGDPFDNSTPAWSDAGTETGASYQQRAGGHHDALYYFGLNAAGALDRNASDRGLLCMNHEAQNTYNGSTGVNSLYIHPTGTTTVAGVRTVADEVIKEINNHGVSVIEVKKDGAGKFGVVKGSSFNRRITGATEMAISGPLSGNAVMKTKFSTDGTRTQGTINNCANGYTPWGTYLTCEENWVGYFKRAAGDAAKRTAKDNASLTRYGKGENTTQRFLWDTAGPGDEFKRWDMSVIDGQPADGTGDFRNVLNTFGWVVEIDPSNPTSTPKKRTAMGRFAHEGCWPAKATAGKPVVFYMGDDNRGDYIYKYVSNANFSASDTGLAAGDKYLDDGKLYAAKFNADGTGNWLELTFGLNSINNAYPNYPFDNQAEVALHTRLAADAARATKMDRPEWGAVNPVNGEVYLTLTNNTAAVRPVSAVDAANPRAYRDVKGGSNQDGNPNGHIIRWRETGNEPSATTFNWDIFLFGAQSDADKATVNLSELNDSNDFSSPDGLWFGRETNQSGAGGLLWIQTDDGAYTDVTNCMMLAAITGTVGDGAVKSITSTIGDNTKTVMSPVGKSATDATVRRFLVGPKQCEITGIDTTPDGKTMFVNIQHPGEESIPNFADPTSFGSHWPDAQFAAKPDARPRSATIVITKDDGGVVGL